MKVYFSGLDFNRTKMRSEDIVQIEFQQSIYRIFPSSGLNEQVAAEVCIRGFFIIVKSSGEDLGKIAGLLE
jgi:hypothetical protein